MSHIDALFDTVLRYVFVCCVLCEMSIACTVEMVCYNAECEHRLSSNVG